MPLLTLKEWQDACTEERWEDCLTDEGELILPHALIVHVCKECSEPHNSEPCWEMSQRQNGVKLLVKGRCYDCELEIRDAERTAAALLTLKGMKKLPGFGPRIL